MSSALPAVVMETTPGILCPACGAAAPLDSLAVPDHEYGVAYLARYAHCRECLSAFQAPMPAGPALASFYPTTYHSVARKGLLARVRNTARTGSASTPRTIASPGSPTITSRR